VLWHARTVGLYLTSFDQGMSCAKSTRLGRSLIKLWQCSYPFPFPEPDYRRCRCYRKFTFSFLTCAGFGAISAMDCRESFAEQDVGVSSVVCVLPEEGSGTEIT